MPELMAIAAPGRMAPVQTLRRTLTTGRSIEPGTLPATPTTPGAFLGADATPTARHLLPSSSGPAAPTQTFLRRLPDPPSRTGSGPTAPFAGPAAPFADPGTSAPGGAAGPAGTPADPFFAARARTPGARTEAQSTATAQSSAVGAPGADNAPDGSSARPDLAGLPRAMTVAPPRVSIRPPEAVSSPAPQAKPASSAKASGSGAALDREFLAAATALLGLPPDGRQSSDARSAPGGIVPSPDTPRASFVRRRSGELDPRSAESHDVRGRDRRAESTAPIPADRIEALVDLVVERIEQRVVDELERRGRRHSRGVF
jgi:hypothetical protein